MEAPELVVVGTPSQDRISIGGATYSTVGGSGFITALAATVSGARSGIVARVPRVLPDRIAAAFGPGMLDPSGLVVVDASLPRFTISYDHEQTAHYAMASMGAETSLSADDLPRRWLATPWIHVAPIGAAAAAQTRFVAGLAARGYAGGLSVGTFIGDAVGDPAAVRALFDRADLAFCNVAEAELIFGSRPPEDTVVVVTRGADGADVWDGSRWRHHRVPDLDVIDPTGAGDAFCGGYLGAMLRGGDRVGSAIARAGEVLSGLGAAPLLDRLRPRIGPTPERATGAPSVAEVAEDQVDAVARTVATEAVDGELDFAGPAFPPVGSPHALETLAVATLHQYGFWYDDEDGYVAPMWAHVAGRRRKGSDVVWERFTAAVESDPAVIDLGRLASDPLLFDRICIDDGGTCPIPDVGSHRVLQQAYGWSMARRGGIGSLVATANRSADPVATFVSSLTSVPGFREDPLQKKARLLALILRNRPERFLGGGSEPGPIIDYHLMRVCLRSGCIDVDATTRERLVARSWVDEPTEAAIRGAAHEAIAQIAARSGLPMGALDGFVFSVARSHCVEMGEPSCGTCPLGSVCARRIDLFQPVFRTTAY